MRWEDAVHFHGDSGVPTSGGMVLENSAYTRVSQ